jgi:hypothetical protein
MQIKSEALANGLTRTAREMSFEFEACLENV